MVYLFLSYSFLVLNWPMTLPIRQLTDTTLLKGISGYIKFLKLNDLENTKNKLKTKKPKPVTK